MRNDFLETLKKHISSGVIEVTPKAITKAQIHHFGETMKGINEFIGAIQTLSLNLARIKNLSEKIEWIDELLKSEKNENTITMLKMQQNAHQTHIKCVYESTKFMGANLFDTDLSCAVNGKIFSVSVGNPMENSANLSQYCIKNIAKLDSLMKALNERLNHSEAESKLDSSVEFDSAVFSEMLGKMSVKVG